MKFSKTSDIELVAMRNQWKQALEMGESYFPAELAQKNLDAVTQEMSERITRGFDKITSEIES